MRGDQLVRVQVEIPKRLCSDERKLIEELADLSKGKTTANSNRWLRSGVDHFIGLSIVAVKNMIILMKAVTLMMTMTAYHLYSRWMTTTAATPRRMGVVEREKWKTKRRERKSMRRCPLSKKLLEFTRKDSWKLIVLMLKLVMEVSNGDIMGGNVSLEKVDNLVHEGSKETHVSISKGCGGSREGESGDVGKEKICGNKGESSILGGPTLEVSRGEGNNDEEGAMNNMGVCKYQASPGKLKKKKKNSGAAAGDKKEKRKNKKDLGVLQSDNTSTVRDILAPASTSHGSKSISKEGVVRNPFTPYHPSSSCSEPSIAAASASQVELVGDSGIMMGNNRFEKAMERSKAEKLWRIAKENLGVTADPADDEIYVEKIKEMEERDTTAKGRKGKTQVSK